MNLGTKEVSSFSNFNFNIIIRVREKLGRKNKNIYPFLKTHFSTSICMYVKLRQYQVGNTSCRKITEVKQFGPWLALGWVTIQVWSGSCSEKYSKISGVEKRGLQKNSWGKKCTYVTGRKNSTFFKAKKSLQHCHIWHYQERPYYSEKKICLNTQRMRK